MIDVRQSLLLSWTTQL